MTDREKRPCQHKRVQHQHGTRLAYSLDHCRCLPCRFANSEYEAARARAKAYGLPTTSWVDASPVRAHVEALQAAGMGWKLIAAAAGVNGSAVSRLLYGRKRPTGQEPPTQRMKGDVAAALLAVPTPRPAELAGGAKVDGTGTRRRLQALVAVGWPLCRLAERLGMDAGNFSRVIAADQVVAGTHRAAVALYDELWDQQPTPGPGPTRARRRAVKEGWPPPAAWDDDSIDDPTVTPDVGTAAVDVIDELAVEAVCDGHVMSLTGATLHAAVRAMTDAGYLVPDIVTRTGTGMRQVQRLRARTTPPRAKAPTATRTAA